MSMVLTYCIVDDDIVCQRMLENIIEDSLLGKVVGTSPGGMEGVELILLTNPHVVLIDFLMPELDGIGMITELKKRGFLGKFIMISQIDNKEMVGDAYKNGIDFFIHKPINSVEVESVLNIIKKHVTLDQSISEIKKSIDILERIQPFTSQTGQQQTVRNIVQGILMEIGIIGEYGSEDMIVAMEQLIEHERRSEFPSLKELYILVARQYKKQEQEIVKEVKAIEQRLRRAVLVALSNLASIGLTDYSNPKFEYYAPLFFDFQEVRLRMNDLTHGKEVNRSKVNLRKFLQVLFLETMAKIK